MSKRKKVLFNEEEMMISKHRIGYTLRTYYSNKPNDIAVFVIMDGGRHLSDFLFSSEWLKNKERFQINYVFVKSYVDNKKLPDNEIYLDLSKINENNLENKCVLIIDDIYDTGNTLNVINKEVIDKGGCPKNVVLVKRSGHHKYNIPLLAYGVEVETDDYLIGCGMDYNGEYRDLPYISSIKEEKCQKN